MIEYVEKGVGLHELIRQSGHWLKEVDGVWKSSDDEAVQTIIDAYVMPDLLLGAKTAKCAEVSLKAKLLRERVTSSIAPGEMASWPIKREEAMEYARLGESASCPALRAEASIRGVSLADLVAKVNGNAARFIAAEAAIGGADGKHRDAIAKLETIEAVMAYDFSADWPEV